ncbi:uncharacterized protein CCOS01_10942 [Colletotrichum costaricense]|uniref:Uncharacterized protein n=1 Tax=Colletotrichum costaricense TaxID=1209916 RepID=A0AAI9YRP6_9PEZI|nr:uncharacterized protein CCOS01_10942 [Colletotrichum costaricense]KAK1520823.1 hypothetical protein CCOS01_10942 [Colletotrichum costaricense]
MVFYGHFFLTIDRNILVSTMLYMACIMYSYLYLKATTKPYGIQMSLFALVVSFLAGLMVWPTAGWWSSDCKTAALRDPLLFELLPFYIGISTMIVCWLTNVLKGGTRVTQQANPSLPVAIPNYQPQGTFQSFGRDTAS